VEEHYQPLLAPDDRKSKRIRTYKRSCLKHETYPFEREQPTAPADTKEYVECASVIATNHMCCGLTDCGCDAVATKFLHH